MTSVSVAITAEERKRLGHAEAWARAARAMHEVYLMLLAQPRHTGAMLRLTLTLAVERAVGGADDR